MNAIAQKFQDFITLFKRAVPGPKEITHDIAHEMEHAAEFLDPKQSDVRYIAPEPMHIESSEEAPFEPRNLHETEAPPPEPITRNL